MQMENRTECYLKRFDLPIQGARPEYAGVDTSRDSYIVNISAHDVGRPRESKNDETALTQFQVEATLWGICDSERQ